MKNFGKKFLSIFLAFVLVLTPILFVGCTSLEDEISDKIEGEIGSGSSQASTNVLNKLISGFKVVYSDSMNPDNKRQISEIKDIFYVDLLNQLTTIYGTSDFPDSIRQTIIKNSEGKAELAENSTGWKWTLDSNSPGCPKDIIESWPVPYEDFLALFNGIKNQYPQLSKFYSTAIQIVMFETLLGFEPTTFEVKTDVEDIIGDFTSIGGNQYQHQKRTFSIRVKNCPSNPDLNGKKLFISEEFFYEKNTESGKEVVLVDGYQKTNIEKEQDSIKAYLSGLMDKYYSTATYSGFTKQNADKFIDYLLNEVVGTDLVVSDYNTYKDTVNYRNYVGTIARIVYEKVYDGSSEYVYTFKSGSTEITYDFNKDDTANKSNQEDETLHQNSFKATPASYMSDFETDAFFDASSAFDFMGDSNSTTSFENSPLAEYQSVVMMLKEDYTFGGMVMQIFCVNPDLDINLSLRFWAFDKETGKGQMFTIKQNKINFYHKYPIVYDGEEESVFVEGKGYLYKATEKDNEGNAINGYYTDFEVSIDVEGVPEKFIELPNANDPSQLQIPYFKVDKFNNDDIKAEGEKINGRTEQSLSESSAYKIIDSENGFGGVAVLDENKLEFSYCEMVFDVVKDLSKEQDYKFKLSVVMPI